MNERSKAPDSAALEALSRQLFRAGAAHPYLRESIENLRRVPDPSVRVLGTDGASVYFAPDAAVDAQAVEHMLMHCLFRHLPPPEGVVRPLWDLACDVSAEYLRTDFFPSPDAKLNRRLIGDALPERVDPRAAGAVYRSLMDLFEDDLDPLYARCGRDDHRYWYAPAPKALFDRPTPEKESFEGSGGAEKGVSFDERDGATYREWLEAALGERWPSEDELPGGTNRTGRYGLSPGSREERMLIREAGKYDFSRYLRRFSTTREEIRLDLGGFDYIPYYYGLERYGNMPLIEPLEDSESHRVEELVIAIDTSGSCTREMVERFLSEIERILMHHEYFFRRMEVHIVQCDAIVQSHVVIHSYEDWKRYTKDLVIKGRSGTNFTPVFNLVDQMRKAGKLKRLKGLLYFTDGEGVYPQKETPYETAFVFVSRKALEFKLPEWIVPLCLEPPDAEG